MMRRSRERLGLREWRAAWLLGLKVREYRALESGDSSIVTGDIWTRMVDVFQWPCVHWSTISPRGGHRIG
jgi:hypothetical protein